MYKIPVTLGNEEVVGCSKERTDRSFFVAEYQQILTDQRFTNEFTTSIT